MRRGNQPSKGPANSVARKFFSQAPPTLLIACAILTLPACTNSQSQRVESQPTPADQIAGVPGDFTLDLAILTPQNHFGKKISTTETDDQAPTFEPTRIMLLPGGLLQAELDGNYRAAARPPLVRRLTNQQIAETWSLLRQLGFGDPAAGDQYTNPKLINAPETGARYILEIHADDRVWMIRRDAQNETDHPAMQHLANYLSGLAWLDTDMGPTMTVAPRLYDFGPDPYARYREDSPE